MVGQVQVRDHVLWTSHISGDDEFKVWLNEVPAGALVDLEIDGWRASWRKMADGKDGRATPGFKPLGWAETRWEQLQAERGRWLSIALCEDH